MKLWDAFLQLSLAGAQRAEPLCSSPLPSKLSQSQQDSRSNSSSRQLLWLVHSLTPAAPAKQRS